MLSQQLILHIIDFNLLIYFYFCTQLFITSFMRWFDVSGALVVFITSNF
jgi:hypothetical protein